MNENEDRLGMTEDQWRRFKDATNGYGDQDENGIDLSLLRENLKLTPTERLERMYAALALVKEIRNAAGRSMGARDS